jgi:hypothetical protein
MLSFLEAKIFPVLRKKETLDPDTIFTVKKREKI